MDIFWNIHPSLVTNDDAGMIRDYFNSEDARVSTVSMFCDRTAGQCAALHCVMRERFTGRIVTAQRSVPRDLIL
jgi:hypothetical protein